MKALSCLAVLGLGLALAEANANPGLCDMCTVSPCDETGVVLVCPDYSGGMPDPVEGCEILVVIRSQGGDPIPNVFVEFVFADPNGLCQCPDLAPSGWTDNNGQVIFNLSTGGCALEDGAVLVRVMDVTIRAYDAVKSPDLNGDCKVTLQDLISFAAAYQAGATGCTDYYNDGRTSLNDFILFGQGWGHECP